MGFVVTPVLYPGKQKKTKRVRYPGESGHFSPNHLHDRFHSAGEAATSRFHFADVSCKLTPPVRAWCRKIVNKRRLKAQVFLSATSIESNAHSERVPLIAIEIPTRQPIAEFVFIPPSLLRMQTRGREIPRSTRPAAADLRVGFENPRAAVTRKLELPCEKKSEKIRTKHTCPHMSMFIRLSAIFVVTDKTTIDADEDTVVTCRYSGNDLDPNRSGLDLDQFNLTPVAGRFVLRRFFFAKCRHVFDTIREAKRQQLM